MVEFYKKRLKNGLTVLFEKRKLPVVTSSVSVKFGSEYEPLALKGVSHFIEHLTFKGTKKRNQKELTEEIEKKGGIINAYTSEETTTFWNKLPSIYLSTGLDIASDLVLNPRFDKKEFEKERKVIIEEIKMYRDNPRLYVTNKIKELLYKKPFSMFGAGTEKTVSKISRKRVIKIFDSVYSTNNMILAVVGKADFDEICEIAEKRFPNTRRKVTEKIPVKINGEKVEKRKGIDQTHFIFGFHVPGLAERERYFWETAGTYLFEGMSSRLFQEIREKRGLAYSVKGNFDLGKNYGYCMIYAGTRKEKLKEVKRIILNEIKKLNRMSQKEFGECKEQLIGMRKIAEEDSFSVMGSLVSEEGAGDAEEYYSYEERINKLKLDEVREISKLKSFSSFALIPE